jgi:hypothetical protein
VRMSPLAGLIADADATLARVQGGAFRAEFNSPMFRRQNTERRKFSLLPPPKSDEHSNVHPNCGISLDFDRKAEFCLLSAVVSGATTEPSKSWSRKRFHNPVPMQTGQTADFPHVELVDSNGLFARLAFHQVRPHRRPSVDAVSRSCALSEPKSRPLLIAGPDRRSSVSLPPGRPVTLPQADSQEPESAPIETLFVELASRRLRRLAARKQPV